MVKDVRGMVGFLSSPILLSSSNIMSLTHGASTAAASSSSLYFELRAIIIDLSHPQGSVCL